MKVNEVHDNIWVFDDLVSHEDCDKVVKLFDDNEKDWKPGWIMSGFENDKVKKTTDYLVDKTLGEQHTEADNIFNNSISKALTYLDESNDKCASYFLDSYDTGYHLKKYVPGDIYNWHNDWRVNRTAALLWYLNDDFAGGHTDFLKQEISIKPRKGSLVVFPSYWTHVHRGSEVSSGEKYIATAWLHTTRESF